MRFAQDAAGPSNSRTVSVSGSESGSTTSSLPGSQSSLPQSGSVGTSGNTPSTPPSTILSDSNELQHPVHAPGTKRYLLLCVNSAPNRTTMRNVDLTNIGHDEVLFQRVRTAYHEMRGTGNRNPFTVPKTIQYVKVRQNSFSHTSSRL